MGIGKQYGFTCRFVSSFFGADFSGGLGVIGWRGSSGVLEDRGRWVIGWLGEMVLIINPSYHPHFCIILIEQRFHGGGRRGGGARLNQLQPH